MNVNVPLTVASPVSVAVAVAANGLPGVRAAGIGDRDRGRCRAARCGFGRAADVEDVTVGRDIIVAAPAIDQVQHEVAVDDFHTGAGCAVGIGRFVQEKVVPVIGRVGGRRAVLVVIGDLAEIEARDCHGSPARPDSRH